MFRQDVRGAALLSVGAMVGVFLGTGGSANAGSGLPEYTVEEIVPPPTTEECDASLDEELDVGELNDHGEVAGWTNCYVDSALKRGERAFRWSSADGAVELPAVETGISSDILVRTFPTSLNENGVVAGYQLRRTSRLVGVKWDASGAATAVVQEADCRYPSQPLRSGGAVYDINDAETVLAAVQRTAEDSCRLTHFLKRTSGEEVPLPPSWGYHALNNVEVVAGGDFWSDENNELTGGPTRWSTSRGQEKLSLDFLGLPVAEPFSGEQPGLGRASINSHGEVTGTGEFWVQPDPYSYVQCLTDAKGVIWRWDGSVQELPTLGEAPVMYTNDINDAGQVVGSSVFEQDCGEPGQPEIAVLWHEGEPYDLNEFLPTDSGISLFRATAINNAGQVVALGYREGEEPQACPRYYRAAEEDSSRVCQPVHAYLLTPVTAIPVPVDVRPAKCPNPLNVNAPGMLPVAITGTAQLDIATVDPATVRLAGVAPLRWSRADVATPFVPFLDKPLSASSCTVSGTDGYLDLVLLFNAQAVAAALGEAGDDEFVRLLLSGKLTDGKAIVGEDIVKVRRN